jgi:cobalt-zinc-cadmium efflux system membrane fusion protein
MIMKTNKILYGICLGSALVLGSCSSKEEAPDDSSVKQNTVLSVDQKKLAGVRTGSLEYKLLSKVIACTGEIEVPPQGMASVTAPMGGYIVETVMVPGNYVKKGALLAKLSNPEYIVLQQSYLETSGQLKFAEQDFLRQKQLEEQNATAVRKLQESESAYTVLKARLAGLKAQLKLIGIDMEDLEEGSIQSVVTLRSPLAGYVTTVNHHPGEFVEPREPIFEIINMDHMHLHLNVFEQDISDVDKNMEIRFRPTGSKSNQYLGKVLLVSPKRNEEVRSFDVHGHIETGEDRLKPGMYVEAEILVSADSVQALPEDALVYRGENPFVLIEDNGGYAVRAVETGIKMDGWVEIRNGETLSGKKIVTQGASRIHTAMRREEQ